MRLGFTAALSVCLVLAGCQKRPRVAILPPPQPRVASPVNPGEQFPEPPHPESTPPVPGSPPVIATDQIVVPPPPPRKLDRRSRKAKTAVLPQVSTPIPTPPEAPPAPRLGQILSSAEQRDYTLSIDADLRSARSSLGQARNLTGNRRAISQQVESFVRQAEALRGSDVLAARGLAHKAAVLAHELLTNN